jgi:hypothetical protein
MTPVLVVLLIAPTALAAVRDFTFDDAVRELEGRLQTRRLRIPFLGFATGVAGVVGRPFGATSFRLAIFDDAYVPDAMRDSLLGDLPPEWRPVLRARRRDQVPIYGREEGSWVRLLMVAVDHNDVVLTQFRLRPTRLMTFQADWVRGDRRGQKHGVRHGP